jgi:hypothetical protein
MGCDGSGLRKRRRSACGAGMAQALVLAALLAAAAGRAGAAEDGLGPGDTLDRTTWQRAKELLPAEVLAHYERGDYVNRLESFDETMEWEPAWHEATRWNREHLTVNDKGTIIDKATGKQPPYVFGNPFPAVDAQDPEAGIKILWNNYYQYYHNGNSRNVVNLTWVSPRGIDRSAGQDVYFLYYDGQPEDLRPRSNPNNLLLQSIATTLNPADLQGTTALIWRFRDSDQRDAVWSYVPALRRVRAVSPTNRSDGFLGSDMSQDDGPFFDGKPEDFVWKLVGERETLALADPYRLKRDCVSEALPGGGWSTTFKDVPMSGFQKPGWDGVAWAPVSHVLLRRPVWVIEGVPKDKYYLYGKMQLYIDRETYQGSWNRKFSWKGELLNTLQVAATGPNRSPDGGKHYFSSGVGGCTTAQIAENVKLNRATVANVDPKTKPINYRGIPLSPSFFDHATLARFGK